MLITMAGRNPTCVLCADEVIEEANLRAAIAALAHGGLWKLCDITPYPEKCRDQERTSQRDREVVGAVGIEPTTSPV